MSYAIINITIYNYIVSNTVSVCLPTLDMSRQVRDWQEGISCS